MASSLQFGKVPTASMATPVKQKDESPQSQPSMAGTSVGSSPSEHSAYNKDSPSLVKQLFRVETMADFYRPTRRTTSAPTPTPSGSPKSTTSSEATVVASWNLSTSKSMLDGGPLDTPPRYIDPWNSPDGFPRTHAFAAAPAVIEEVHPEEHPTGMSCSTLTQGSIADMFVSLQKGRSIWSKDPETPARSTPEPASSPAIDPRQMALWRECQELKRIIQEDSLRIVNMKRAMEAQQELNELKEVELDDKQMELQIAMSRIECLKKEKAIIWERQDELLETIEILKEEVDKLSVMVERNINTELTPSETLPIILDECILPDASSVVEASVAETCSTVEEEVIEEIIEEEIVEDSDVHSFTDESIDSEEEDPLEVVERAVSEVTLDEEEEDELLVVQLPQSLGPAQGEQALEVVRVPLFEVCEENDDEEEEMMEEESIELQVNDTEKDDVEEKETIVAEEAKELTVQETPVVEALVEKKAETREATVAAVAPTPVPDLTSLLESLSKRLEAVENEKVSKEQKLLEALERKNAELEDIRQTLKLDPSTVEFLKILQDPDEIEVFVPKGKDDSKDATMHSSCCCGTLPIFTDDIE